MTIFHEEKGFSQEDVLESRQPFLLKSGSRCHNLSELNQAVHVFVAAMVV